MSDSNSFKEKLDQQYQWPSLYTFKFITPLGMVEKVRSIFPSHDIREKPSSKGNYISLSISMMARSSDEVVEVYLRVHELGGGIISL